MLDENKHIDSLFADGLKGVSIEPKPEVWNAISENLAAAKRKRRGVIIFVSAALAASVLLFIAIANRDLFIPEPGNLPWQQISDHSSDVNRDVKNRTSIENNGIAQNSGDKLEKDDQDLIASNKLPSKEQQTSAHSAFEINENQFQKIPLIYSIPSRFGGLGNSVNEIKEGLQYLGANKSSAVHLSSEDEIVMYNLMAIELANKEELRQNRWAIIGQLSSAYSNEESASNVNSGIVSIGGGIKVSYALGNKLAIQTGFMYNRMGQDFGRGNQQLAFSPTNALDGTPNDEFNSAFKVLPANSSAGNINYTRINQQNAGKSEYLVASTKGSSEELMQSFETIEVPILLRYNLYQKRLGVYLNGGLGANWIIDNGVYRSSRSKQKIGKIDNLRTTNFSSLFGLGFEYKLSSKIHIGLEPSFKYYLNSINKSSQFNYKPYSIGIQTGIRYNF
ncbi:hypothetical protein [Marinifilum sp.]|uniref:hypothetical protein n=1 Tax=Marinifilum sp. TaxID=2033137 RepID=UPI003BADB796